MKTPKDQEHLNKEPLPLPLAQGVKPYIQGTKSVSVNFIAKNHPRSPPPPMNKTDEKVAESSNTHSKIHISAESKGKVTSPPTSRKSVIDKEAPVNNTYPPFIEGNLKEKLQQIEQLMEEDDLLGEDLQANTLQQGPNCTQMESHNSESEDNPMESANSQVSSHSQSSFLRLMNTMGVQAQPNTNSDSMKRKEDAEGEDTASSKPKRYKANNVSHE